MRFKKIVIVLICLIILVIMGIVVFLQTPYAKSLQQLSYINDKNSFNIETMSSMNSYLLSSRYYGDANIKIVDKSLNYFAKELLPKYTSLSDVKSYYNQNKTEIQMFLGINTFEEFEGIVERAKSLNASDFVLERIDFIDGTSERTENGVKIIVAIQYEQTNRVYFTIELNNKIQQGVSTVKYSSELNETYRTYDTARIEKSTDSKGSTYEFTSETGGRATNYWED